MNALNRNWRIVTTIAAVLLASPAIAQQKGGILHIYHRDSPASMSIHEEASVSTIVPAMGIMNNLVIYNQNKAQNSLDTIVPDLATNWAWSEDGKMLTFDLREGVKWHDGNPFTAKDVKCTFDLLQGKSQQKLRLNPRAVWYHNLDEVDVTGNGNAKVVFHLKRPQPAFLALLASGYTPIYPCHVPLAQMRHHPIGTGPFKFVEFRPNESIKLIRNPDYWKKDRPYLDGVEYTIVPNRSTAILGFITRQFDMTFPTEVSAPLLKDINGQAPQAVCQSVSTNVSTNLLINRYKPPFDDPEIRHAIMLTLDRRAFIDILSDGKANIGGAMLPESAGVWGLPDDVLVMLPGYGPDVERNRDEARMIMKKLGYGQGSPLKIKVSTRNIAPYRDRAIILIDQFKNIFINAELDAVETANWFPKLTRKDYQIGLNLTGSSIDDPDQQFYENYYCGSPRNYDGYCNKKIDQLIDQQSAEMNQIKRQKLVWEIDSRLQEDAARPIIMHNKAATCWHSYVNGITLMVNSSYNGWRMEEWWIDKNQQAQYDEK
jgi:peptide/nickel transport system substrate-binding protein